MREVESSSEAGSSFFAPSDQRARSCSLLPDVWKVEDGGMAMKERERDRQPVIHGDIIE